MKRLLIMLLFGVLVPSMAYAQPDPCYALYDAKSLDAYFEIASPILGEDAPSDFNASLWALATEGGPCYLKRSPNIIASFVGLGVEWQAYRTARTDGTIVQPVAAQEEQQSVAETAVDACEVLYQIGDPVEFERYVGNTFANVSTAQSAANTLWTVTMLDWSPCPGVAPDVVARNLGIVAEFDAVVGVMSGGDVVTEETQIDISQSIKGTQSVSAIDTTFWQRIQSTVVAMITIVIIGMYAYNRGIFDSTIIRRKVNGHAPTADFQAAKPVQQKKTDGTMDKYYATEQTVIGQFFTKKRMAVTFHDAPRVRPAFVIYPFRMTGAKTTIQKIRSNVEHLQSYMSEYRISQGASMANEYGDPAELTCHVMTNPLAIVINKLPKDVDTLLWKNRNQSKHYGMVVIGRRYDGLQVSNAQVNFNDPVENNMLVVAPPGGGKNKLVDALIMSLMDTTQNAQFVFVNADNDSFAPYNKLSGTVGYAETIDGGLLAMRAAQKIMDGREINSKSVPPLFLIVDEFHMFTRGASNDISRQALDLLIDMSSRGRKRNVFLILISQRPQHIDTNIREICKVKAVGGVSADDENLIFGHNHNGASSLRNPGEFILERPATGAVRIHAYYIDNVDALIPDSGHKPTCYDDDMPQLDNAFSIAPTVTELVEDIQADEFEPSIEVTEEIVTFINANTIYGGEEIKTLDDLRNCVKFSGLTEFYHNYTGNSGKGRRYQEFSLELKKVVYKHLIR